MPSRAEHICWSLLSFITCVYLAKREIHFIRKDMTHIKDFFVILCSEYSPIASLLFEARNEFETIKLVQAHDSKLSTHGIHETPLGIALQSTFKKCVLLFTNRSVMIGGRQIQCLQAMLIGPGRKKLVFTVGGSKARGHLGLLYFFSNSASRWSAFLTTRMRRAPSFRAASCTGVTSVPSVLMYTNISPDTCRLVLLNIVSLASNPSPSYAREPLSARTTLVFRLLKTIGLEKLRSFPTMQYATSINLGELLESSIAWVSIDETKNVHTLRLIISMCCHCREFCTVVDNTDGTCFRAKVFIFRHPCKNPVLQKKR